MWSLTPLSRAFLGLSLPRSSFVWVPFGFICVQVSSQRVYCDVCFLGARYIWSLTPPAHPFGFLFALFGTCLDTFWRVCQAKMTRRECYIIAVWRFLSPESILASVLVLLLIFDLAPLITRSLVGAFSVKTRPLG